MIYLTGQLVWNKAVMLLKLLLRKTESSNVFFLQTLNNISCLSGSEVTLHVLITGLKITHINSQVIFLYTKYIILSAQVSVCRGQISYLLTLKISSWGCKILFLFPQDMFYAQVIILYTRCWHWLISSILFTRDILHADVIFVQDREFIILFAHARIIVLVKIFNAQLISFAENILHKISCAHKLLLYLLFVQITQVISCSHKIISWKKKSPFLELWDV